MANNNWILGYTANWSTASGWSLGHVPTTDEIAIFSNTFGNGDCTIDQNVDCSGITISGTYTANQTAAGFGYYLTGNYIDDGTGSRDLGSGMIFNGPTSTGHFGATLGAVTATSCILVYNASGGVLDDDKGISTFKKLIIGNNATLTSVGSSLVTEWKDTDLPLTIGNSGTLTSNTVSIFSVTDNGMFLSFGTGAVFNGSSNPAWRIKGSGKTVGFPTFTYTGTGRNRMDFADGITNSNINLSGNVIFGNLTIRSLSAGTSGSFFNTNNFNMNVSDFSLGTASSAHQLTFNLGSSTIFCNTFNVGEIQNNLNTNLNLQSSTINCSGAWVFGSNHNVNPGTSVVTIKNTSTVTSANKAFYDFGINTAASGTVITFADSPKFSGDFSVTQGSTKLDALLWSGYGDILFNGTGNHTIGSGITLVNSGTFTLASTLLTCISAGCYIKCLSDATLNLGTRTINRLGLTSGQKYFMTAGAPILTVNTYTAADWDGASFYSTGAWGLKMVPSATVNNVYVEYSDNSTGTEINATAGTNTDGGNNINWLFTSYTPPAVSGFLPTFRFYNPLLHNVYVEQNNRRIRALKRYMGL